LPDALIRQATAADAPAIARIWEPVIRETTITFSDEVKSPAAVAALVAERAAAGFPFLLAEAGGEPLGFASYAQFRGGNGYARCMEHTIILAPVARGQGTGRRLMTAIEAHAAARGAHSLWAGVSGENAAGIAFHAALGYAHAATLRETGFKFGRWLDLVLMVKYLPARRDLPMPTPAG